MWGSIADWKNSRLTITHNGSTLYLFKKENDLLIRQSKGTPDEKAASFLLEDRIDSPYSRIILDKSRDSIVIRPLLPDKPVIAYPKYSMKIPAGLSYSFYASIPVCVSIMNDTSKNILEEFHFEPLKQTWFGKHPTVGELCYSTTIIPIKKIETPVTLTAYVYITYINKSSLPVDIKKIKIPAPSLSLWIDDTQTFYTDRIVYSYSDQEEHIEKIEHKPLKSFNNSLARIGEPRQDLTNTFLNLMRYPWILNHS